MPLMLGVMVLIRKESIMSESMEYFIGPIVHPFFIILTLLLGMSISVFARRKLKLKAIYLPAILLPGVLIACLGLLLVMQMTNIREETDFAFIQDDALLGEWNVIGFGHQDDMQKFIQNPQSPDIGLKRIVFNEDGTTDSHWFSRWTHGKIISECLRTNSSYEIV